MSDESQPAASLEQLFQLERSRSEPARTRDGALFARSVLQRVPSCERVDIRLRRTLIGAGYTAAAVLAVAAAGPELDSGNTAIALTFVHDAVDQGLELVATPMVLAGLLCVLVASVWAAGMHIGDEA